MDISLTVLRLAMLVVTCISSVAQAYKDATPQHYSLYLYAQYSQQQKESQRAQECYAQLFRLKAPVYTYSGYFEHLYNLGNFPAIIRLLPQIKGLLDDQKDIQVIIGQSLELSGKKDEAENIFITLYEHHKNQADVAYYAAAAYTRRHNFSQALAVIDDYLNSTPERPSHFMFYFLKSKVYQFLNNEKAAAESLKKALELYKLANGIACILPINRELPLVANFIDQAYCICGTSLEQSII